MFHHLGRKASNEVLHDVDKTVSIHGPRIFGLSFLFVAFFDFSIIFWLELSMAVLDD